MSKEKTQRQLNLIALLLETMRPLTAEEIRQKLPDSPYPDNDNSFRRAFERDKDDLRGMLVPIVTEEVPFSDPPQIGYRILSKDYYLEDPGLTNEELAALKLAAGAIQVEGQTPSIESLRKLGGVVSDPSDEGETLAVLPVQAGLADVFRAQAERRVISFGFRGERRRLQPYALSFQRGHWYVAGFDEDRAATRNFRLDRIEGDIVVGSEPGAFELTAPTDIQLQSWLLGDGEPVEATVLVDAEIAAHARQEFGDAAHWETRPDGSAVLTLAVTNPENFRSFVLTYLEDAEVLGPPDLRNMVVSWLEDLVS
ncbi:MAG TPA: WYL domain-containing protein [Microthrixaceae bacterium]|nr:WYL domain-containing protein [Microthrixaceae bacterium]